MVNSQYNSIPAVLQLPGQCEHRVQRTEDPVLLQICRLPVQDTICSVYQPYSRYASKHRKENKNFLFLTFLSETNSRTDKGQPGPKYIFKCGTNIYFFTLQRFGPSPSPNLK